MDMVQDKHLNVPLVLNDGVGKHPVLAGQWNVQSDSLRSV